ncbi:MAG TPA: anthranilate synthase component I family protein [Gemmatimonadales bacterium]|nr:anthranilate synthase component I family protein [Gemmatimonadales bacterium]
MPWYGVLSYEAGLPEWVSPSRAALLQPLADWFVPANRILLGRDGRAVRLDGPEALARWRETPAPGSRAAPAAPPVLASRPWRSFNAPAFAAAVRRAHEYIAAGDIYQVNLAVAECWEYPGTAWDAYRRLRAVNPSPWMGFANFGDWQLVCGSPELLVEVTAGLEGYRVRTRPIAGTRKKTGDASADARMRAELRLDEKERAEHLMLVDLARNDLGRVATFGSVHVAEQEVVEEYSHVFHLVSEVRGRVRPDADLGDVVGSVFPGGTITGCPKLRAMEIIRELEPVGRGAYTGALGWIGAGEGQLNIVIRSAVASGGEVLIQAGAGVVADSIPEREWRESLRKAEAVRLAFGVSLAEP